MIKLTLKIAGRLRVATASVSILAGVLAASLAVNHDGFYAFLVVVDIANAVMILLAPYRYSNSKYWYLNVYRSLVDYPKFLKEQSALIDEIKQACASSNLEQPSESILRQFFIGDLRELRTNLNRYSEYKAEQQ